MSDNNLNSFIEHLAASDLSREDQVLMFVSMCDGKQVMAELTRQGFMRSAELVPPSVVHAFAYGVLRLARPELFDKQT